jgi:hypothetical protein
MRAIQFKAFGDLSVLELAHVAGAMKQTTLPRIPGRDYSGVVERGLAEWIGAEVWGTGGDTGFTRDGTHVELLAVPAASLRREPETLASVAVGHDRYRGVFEGQMVVFMNSDYGSVRNHGGYGGENGSLANDRRKRRVSEFKAHPYSVPRGPIAAYYRETNLLLPLSHGDQKSKTAAAKSIPVLVQPQSNMMVGQ